MPTGPGSSLKGSLREVAGLTLSLKGGGPDKDLLKKLFGPDTANASEHAGSLIVGDANLLLLPVRSVAGTFAWVTSPYLLHRFFRDTKSAQVTFTLPKLPSTVAGCMIGMNSSLVTQGKMLFENLDLTPTAEWAKKILGGRTEPGSLAIRGPFLAVSSDLRKSPLATREGPLPLLPPPLDLAIPKPRDKTNGMPRNPTECCVVRLQPRSQAEYGDVAPVRYHFNGNVLQAEQRDKLPWCKADLDKESLTDKYLFTKTGAQKYLKHGASTEFALSIAKDLREIDLSANDLISQRSVYEIEERIGIARNPDTLTAQEGMFYLVLSFRFAQGAGFAIEVDLESSSANADDRNELRRALDQLHGGVVLLGGRGHRARVHVCKQSFLRTILAQSQGSEGSEGTAHRKVWLLSPLPWPSADSELAAVETLITGRPQVIGGFDQGKGCPKPLRLALPAGSILYLQERKDWESVRKQLGHGPGSEDFVHGYGLAILGS